MPYLKVVLFSILGFSIPIVCALHFGPQLFESAMPPSEYVRGSLASPEQGGGLRTAEDGELPVTDPQEAQSAYRSVASDDSLDPGADRYFLVSVDFKIASLPKMGRRQKLISKYASGGSPNPGWALAIRRLNTSTRPEIYWQNKDGKGGWYTFDNVRFERNQWYSLTLVARDGDLLSLYIQQLTTQGQNELSEEGDEPSELGVGAKFIGGYNLDGQLLTPTAAALEFSAPVSENNEFRGEVRNILLAQPRDIPQRHEKLRSFLEGGAGEIASRFEPGEVSLFIDENGRDTSAAQRAVSTAVSRS